MTEQDHKARVQAWLDEAGDEPTPFGKAVIHVAQKRGFASPEELDLEPDHQAALADHCDGVEDAERPMDLALAVVHAIGLDRHTVPAEAREDLVILARARIFGELAFKEPLPARR